jgi:hypothetical protein
MLEMKCMASRWGRKRTRRPPAIRRRRSPASDPHSPSGGHVRLADPVGGTPKRLPHYGSLWRDAQPCRKTPPSARQGAMKAGIDKRLWDISHNCGPIQEFHSQPERTWPWTDHRADRLDVWPRGARYFRSRRNSKLRVRINGNPWRRYPHDTGPPHLGFVLGLRTIILPSGCDVKLNRPSAGFLVVGQFDLL